MAGKFDTDEVLAAAKMRRITDSESADVFIAGYSKSGDTWMQCLLVGSIFGSDARLVPDSLVTRIIDLLSGFNAAGSILIRPFNRSGFAIV